MLICWMIRTCLPYYPQRNILHNVIHSYVNYKLEELVTSVYKSLMFKMVYVDKMEFFVLQVMQIPTNVCRVATTENLGLKNKN